MSKCKHEGTYDDGSCADCGELICMGCYEAVQEFYEDSIDTCEKCMTKHSCDRCGEPTSCAGLCSACNQELEEKTDLVAEDIKADNAERYAAIKHFERN